MLECGGYRKESKIDYFSDLKKFQLMQGLAIVIFALTLI